MCPGITGPSVAFYAQHLMSDVSGIHGLKGKVSIAIKKVEALMQKVDYTIIIFFIGVLYFKKTGATLALWDTPTRCFNITLYIILTQIKLK